MFRNSPNKGRPKENGSRKDINKFLENSFFIRHYIWKYKQWVGFGLLALVVVDTLEILPPIFLKRSVDIIVDHQPIRLLGIMAMAYWVTSLIQGACRYIWRMYLIRASIHSGRDLRNRYVGHLFGLSVSFFERTQLGNLMSLATNDVEAVRVAIGSGLLVFADALFYLLTIPVAMIILSPQLTLLACLPLPFVPWIVLKNEKEIHRRFEKVQECFGKISAITQENLNGIRVIKAFAREDTQIDRIRRAGDEYVQLNLSLARIQTVIGPFMDLVMSIGMVLLLFFGGRWMIQSPSQAITLGTFVAFQRYIQKMVWPMAALGMAVNYYQRSVSSSNRLKSVFSILTDVPEIKAPLRPEMRKGRIEFKNLHFNFPGSQNSILSGINLTIEPGERLAFIGSIGSGKSALLSLLPRLYPIERGMLWIDGIDVNDWKLEDLRRQVGYVSQDVFLFSESVMENVAFGLHEWSESLSSLSNIEDSVEAVTRLSSIHEEIQGFSSSYKTLLGERGISLSGGQKQRLTIARALIKQPSILVLDDALSSVDVQTEDHILKGLRSRPGRNTELIAAHRVSTIQDSDRIVVLQEGRISQIGTHRELIKASSGDYYRFFEQQQLKEDLEHYTGELSSKYSGENLKETL